MPKSTNRKRSTAIYNRASGESIPTCKMCGHAADFFTNIPVFANCVDGCCEYCWYVCGRYIPFGADCFRGNASILPRAEKMPASIPRIKKQRVGYAPTARNVGSVYAWCYCCQVERPIQWKPESMRGRKYESWFKCGTCGADNLSFHMIKQNGGK